jgi:hypothetical protein
MTDKADSGAGDTLDPPGGHSKEAVEDAIERTNIDEGEDGPPRSPLVETIPRR